MTIFDQLDQHPVAPPASRAPEHFAHLGRRALRRRRGLQAAASAGVLAVLAIPFAVGGGDAPRTAEPAAASPASPSSSPTGEPTPEPGLRIENGALVAAGLEVTRQVDDVFATSVPSFAVEVRDGAKQTWSLVWGESSPTSVKTERAGRSAETFEGWLATVSTRAGSGLALVRFGAGDELVPERGRTIVTQTSEVDLPENFASPTDPTAAAEVDYAGERWYVLARTIAGSEPEYITYPRTAEVRSLPAFLAFADLQYGAEVGLR